MVMEKGGWAINQAGQDITFPLWVAGRYYGQTTELTLTTATYHEMMFAVPVFFPGANGVAIDELGLEFTGGGTAGGLARVGIYEDLEGVPCDLLLDAGTIPVDAVGWQHIDVTVRLRGWNWLAIAFADYASAPTYRAVATGMSVLGTPRPDDTNAYTHYNPTASLLLVTVGLPARFPRAPQATGGYGNCPRLMVRCA